MMCGLQGCGKTTHSAKLAKMFKKQGHRPLLVACDVYRPAAINQLQVVGEQVGVPVFEMGTEDPVKIAEEAVKHAKDYGNDYRYPRYRRPSSYRRGAYEGAYEHQGRRSNPHEILLVIDAMTGQDAVNVAKSFNETLGIDGVILTKLDGDTQGGAALSVRAVTGKPIKFVGTGEKLDNLETFHPTVWQAVFSVWATCLPLLRTRRTSLTRRKPKKWPRKSWLTALISTTCSVSLNR